jgi:DNA-binding response OmpR family regulator
MHAAQGFYDERVLLIMDRKKILIAEKEANEVVDLRKALVMAGYEVRIAATGPDAMALIQSFHPDLIIAEMRLPQMDGPHLLQEVRNFPALQWLPFVLMGSLKTLDERVSAMKLAVDDYLQKPVDPDETVARVESLIREAELRATVPDRQSRGFSGSLGEMSLVDLLQTLEVGNKTAVVRLRHANKEGMIYIAEGQVVDATLEALDTRRALLRMFTWNDGSFHVDIRMHDRSRSLTASTRDLISEGMTRMYRWEQLSNQLPPLQSVVNLNGEAGKAKITEEEKGLLLLVRKNGSKRIIDLVEESQYDDLRALTVIKNLYERHILKALPWKENPPVNDYNRPLLKPLHQNGKLSSENINSAFQAMLKKPAEAAPKQHDRRRVERRQEDRRKHERRRDSPQREKMQIFLNKSELILIREKLLNDVETKRELQRKKL